MVAAEIYKLNEALTKERERVAEKEDALGREQEALEELRAQVTLILALT